MDPQERRPPVRREAQRVRRRATPAVQPPHADRAFAVLGRKVFDKRTYHLEGGAGDNTPLLRSIEYVFVGEQPRYTVSFDYEDRPDTQSDCAGGFEVRLSRRLAGVQM